MDTGDADGGLRPNPDRADSMLKLSLGREQRVLVLARSTEPGGPAVGATGTPGGVHFLGPEAKGLLERLRSLP